MNKFFHGSNILLGNSTIPGVSLPEDLKEYILIILQKCRDFGLDFFPTIVQPCTYDEISELAAYGGFPVRYPHWRWGMEYESLQRGFEYGMYRIFEMVIPTNPCIIYYLNSNTLVDNLTIIAHATGHNHFFKNNIYFGAIDTNMLNKMANHATRIRRYMSRWGNEKVSEFIDHVLRIDTLIDGSEAWTERTMPDRNIVDKREYYQPRRLNVDKDRLYMEPFLNTKEFRDKENENIAKKEMADEIGLFKEPTKNILGFIRDNAPLKPWQQDIVAMLYEESLYYAPMRITKTINEGAASAIDHEIMSVQGFCSLGQKSDDMGIVEYSAHKMSVLGGHYSMNPYKLGFSLLLDIQDRWNKGRFGTEWEECNDVREKEKWDKKLGLGKEKFFEVINHYNDFSLINEFFTEDFCREQEYFVWKHYPNGETKFEDRNYKEIKKNLMQRALNGGLPDIRLTEPNYRGKGHLMLENNPEGKELYKSYVEPVLSSISKLWGNDVHLATKDKYGKEIVYSCIEGSFVNTTRKEHTQLFYDKKK